MRIGRETEPAKFLGDDHAEEFVALDEGPRFRRQIAPFPIDLPLVEHGAELVDGAVEKGLLFVGQRRRRVRQQFRPIGIAGERGRRPTRRHPASSASRSVSDIAGNTPRAQEKIGLLMKSRRKLMANSPDLRRDVAPHLSQTTAHSS
jgi:hypothetical protein